MTSKILGILDCDELAPELKEEYQNYGRMFRQLLAPVASDWQLQRYAILEGTWPEQVSECDAYLITGSKTGVYDSDAWLAPLKQFVTDAYDASIPLVGICFGHQFLANSLGGKAEKSSKGWGVGVRKVFADEQMAELKLDWMSPYLPSLNLLYSHQDQVTQLPPNASKLYGDEFCQLAAFHIDGRVLAFQGHPEFTKPYMNGLMDIRKARYAPGQYELALESLDQDEDGATVATWIFSFLEYARNKTNDDGKTSSGDQS